MVRRLITDTVRAGKVVERDPVPCGGVEEKRYATGDALARQSSCPVTT
ncbi:MAG: hypothetical protein ACLUE1_00715 [Adlercreutzia equolifaciens]